MLFHSASQVNDGGSKYPFLHVYPRICMYFNTFCIINSWYKMNWYFDLWSKSYLLCLVNLAAPLGFIQDAIYKIYKSKDDTTLIALHWRHNGHGSVSNHQPHDCLLKRLFRRRSNKTSKLRVTGLCAGNSPGTGEFPTQMVSNAENVSICWRHHRKHRYHFCNISRPSEAHMCQ